MSTTTTTTTELLTLVHQYQSLHSDANTKLKSSIWNITKARRERGKASGGGGFGSVPYSAEDVREELRAQALLEVTDGDGSEPELVCEDGNGEVEDTKEGGGQFVLHFDGMKEVGARNNDKYGARHVVSTNDNDGLRRRGNAATTTTDDNIDKWTQDITIDDEEEKLRTSDPLSLFGVPPPALRLAQSKSRDAVAYYVEVANLAREILRITHASSKE
eukprot:scaffold933_cov190-Alexandrium_tamarense.AAC.8